MTKSEQMLEALEQEDLLGADRYFQEALQEDRPETLLDLADYLESIGFFPQAKLVYEKFLDDYPEVAINLANIAMEDGQTEEAFAYLDRIDESSPYYIQALASQADFYQLEGLADVAREKLLLALSLSDEPLLHFGLAELEMELGHYQVAIRTYAGLDNRDIFEMTGVSTYQRIGLAYARSGKFEAAIEFLEKALELEYEDQTLYELAVLLLEQEDYQRANLYFKQLETLNPDFEGYHYPYAQSLHAEHETKEALRLIQEALAKDETSSALLLLASQYAYEVGQADLAEGYLIKAKTWADDTEELDLRLSSLYLEQERYEELIDLDRADLDNVLTRWQIAKGYRVLEEEEAMAKYQDLLADLSDNPEFLRDYALFLREEGQVEQARQILGHYLELIPDDLEMAGLYQDLSD